MIKGTQYRAIGEEHAKAEAQSLIDQDEAFLLFKKWRDESTPLRLLANLSETIPGLVLCFDGTITRVEGTRIMLSLNERDFCLFDFELSVFTWGEPKDLPPTEAAEGGHAFASILAVRPLSAIKDRFLFMEISSIWDRK